MDLLLAITSLVVAAKVISAVRVPWPNNLIAITALSLTIYAFSIQLFRALLDLFSFLFTPVILIPLLLVAVAAGGYLWYRNRMGGGPFEPW